MNILLDHFKSFINPTIKNKNRCEISKVGRKRYKKIFPADEEDMKRILQTVGRSLTLNFEQRL